MLNRTPTNTSKTIDSYRKKRQQKGPMIMYGAIALVVLGLLLLLYWLTRPDQPLGGFFATDTPTVTATATATNTATATLTPTITETPTITLTATPAEPFPYTVQEGDSLFALAERFNLGPDGALLIYYENLALMEANGGDIRVGDTITIPLPGSVLPTTTPIPSNLGRGTLIDYRILPGDTLAGIAVRFNSLPEEIMAENGLEDADALFSGQILKIPVNLVTATATLPATSTPVTPTVAGGQATAASPAAASTGTSDGTASCAFTENAEFVGQLEDLINEERANAGVPALNLNTQLTAAAKAHAIDMLCNNYLSHLGLNGSTPEDRVRAAGFTASLVKENLFAMPPVFGGNPQAAMDWWLSDPAAKADLLNRETTTFGIAYVASDTSLFGGYFVVVAAKP